jgi:hypothetical protein
LNRLFGRIPSNDVADSDVLRPGRHLEAGHQHVGERAGVRADADARRGEVVGEPAAGDARRAHGAGDGVTPPAQLWD